MKTTNIIDGLNILRAYYDEKNLYTMGAEHDVVYAYATNKPLIKADVEKMVDLGWAQHDADTGDDEDFEAKHYDPEEGWAAYV